jgi:E3 ubiquitin-protein ligase DOA10
MSIRKAGGEWEPMLLPIEPRHCKVCRQGLYRDKTMFRGGWSRCTVCDEFVHYSCLASGKVSFLKARPRVCKACRAAQAQEGTSAPSPTKVDTPVPVGS